MDAATPKPSSPKGVITIAIPADGSDELTIPHALAARLRAVVQQGYDVIFLDVAQLGHCNSMTLGAIVQTYVTAVRNGGSVKLVNVRRRFRELLAVTKIDHVIEILEGDFREQPRVVLDPESTQVGETEK